MTLTRAIVRRWMALAGTTLPDAARDAARLHLMDAVGVGLAAGRLAQGAPYRRHAAQKAAGGGIATLAGSRVADAATAALIDGGLIHSLEYDDTHTGSIIHGSAVLAATALAAGQARGARLERMLGAYLLGYEALIRLGLGAPGAFQQNGFQVTSVAGTLAAALVAADLMDLDEDQRVFAAGIALSQSSGVFEFLTNGASVKSMHPGWAAHAGVVAAELAAAGLTGPETALEGARGLYAAFARDGTGGERLNALIEDFGQRWHMPEVAFKFVPCCHYLHPFVEAAGLIAAACDSAAIAALTLRIAPGAAPIVCEPWADKLAPRDGHAIRWSLPVVVATRLIEGRVDHDTFARPARAEVLALAGRSRWEPLEPNRFPLAFEAEIDCRLLDGRRLTQRIADVYGNAGRPASRVDVLAKFADNAGRALPEAAWRALADLLLGGDAPLALYADMLCPLQKEAAP